MLCQAENEDLKHFLLKCPEMSEIRKENSALMQPYIEDKDDVAMNFLFDSDKKKMEEKKYVLYKMWRFRKTKTKSSIQVKCTLNKPSTKVK